MSFRPDQSAKVVHRELTAAVGNARNAQHGVLVWFTEMKRRKLFREFGCGSMRQYATQKLGFSETRAGDFNRLAERLGQLPSIRQAVQSGQLGYTKARVIVAVASPKTEAHWLEAACTLPRKQLVEQVQKVRCRKKHRRRAAITGQAELLPDREVVTPAAEADRQGRAEHDGQADRHDQTGDADQSGHDGQASDDDQSGRDDRASSPDRQPQAAAPTGQFTLDDLADAAPSTVSLRLTAEQRARYDALWAALGRAPEAETVLRALAILLEQDADTAEPMSSRNVPRGAPPTRPPVQIHVQLCPECAAMTAAGRTLDPADRERLSCDAEIAMPGQRNTATIKPSIRRQVLARDDHRCQAPGCGHRQFLEIHHLVPRAQGGTNHPDNLITLCAACHRAWHEHGASVAGVREAREIYGVRPDCRAPHRVSRKTAGASHIAATGRPP